MLTCLAATTVNTIHSAINADTGLWSLASRQDERVDAVIKTWRGKPYLSIRNGIARKTTNNRMNRSFKKKQCPGCSQRIHEQQSRDIDVRIGRKSNAAVQTEIVCSGAQRGRGRNCCQEAYGSLAVGSQETPMMQVCVRTQISKHIENICRQARLRVHVAIVHSMRSTCRFNCNATKRTTPRSLLHRIQYAVMYLHPCAIPPPPQHMFAA